MRMEELIGILAGIFTTIAAVPQIYRAWKTKKIEDVSPKMFLILTIGVLLWTVYGIMKKDVPIILTNGISTLLNSTMLFLILKFRKK
ncbi:MtN3 and saliva related transmembrane protein [Maribacter spongiicola]|uniref:MtN3 and saliva related transmembrane protein n=2 Tax=Maribacter spongiicola TaxID=1206753 RepID=A0A4R7JZY7_9FLAO|nr:MtN3 and saliva related transmembrane protein [Maribacter spongiicola]